MPRHTAGRWVRGVLRADRPLGLWGGQRQAGLQERDQRHLHLRIWPIPSGTDEEPVKCGGTICWRGDYEECAAASLAVSGDGARLAGILPAESIRPGPRHRRRSRAAFLSGGYTHTYGFKVWSTWSRELLYELSDWSSARLSIHAFVWVGQRHQVARRMVNQTCRA